MLTSGTPCGWFAQRAKGFVRWHSRLPVALLLVGVGPIGCCTAKPPPMTPTCPQPTLQMIIELRMGTLDDAPSTQEYLGRIENICDALEGYD